MAPSNKIKTNKNITVPKSNFKIIEKDKTDTPNLQIHDRSLFVLGIVLWAQTSLPS